METEISFVFQLLSEPFNYVVEPGRRLFWLFLLSALVLASVVVTIQKQRFDLRAQLNALCNRRYWVNSSTLTDLVYVFVNNALRMLIVVPLLGSHLAATIFVGSLLQSNLGDAPDLGLSLFVIGLLYTLTFFIFEDLSRFLLHLAMHRLPGLWYFHKVHHSATVLTPLTVHRVHPVEMALYYTRGLVVFGLVSGTFVYLFQGRVHGWQILGVDCLGFLFSFFGANLRHSHIRLSFGIFEKWFISPVQHQIHHSCAVEHHDKNFGTCLALWDRLNGSWVKGATSIKFVFGLPERSNRYDEKLMASTSKAL